MTTNNDDVEVLLAEDNPLDAELTLRAFKKSNLANKIVWVKDGVEVLEFLATHRLPKVLLLDLKMPRMDGLEVLQELKKDERLQSLPVVMMTSSNLERDVVESYRYGVNGFVVKPVDFAKFADVVAQIGLYWLVVNRVPAV
jgi:two-component system response regulator